MEFGTLAQQQRDNTAPFRAAFDFLAQLDPQHLPEGDVVLEAGVSASVKHTTTNPAEALLFETHDRYYDIHYILQGEEYMGLAPREQLQLQQAYDPQNDITRYEKPQDYDKVRLGPGMYLVVGTEEGHMPLMCVDAPASIVKVVVKVPA